MQPYVNNTGCDSASGLLRLIKDSRVDYDASLSTNPATYVVGDTLVWAYTNLTNLTNGAYWNSFLSNIHLTPNSTVVAGDTLSFRIFSDILPTDINPYNNDFTFYLPVVAAYDPNIMEVSPKGIGTEGFIPASTDTLTYTVHFQNTGTATAYNVTVIDTLDSHVDPSILHIQGASNTMKPEWLAPGIVAFHFHNINLTDSFDNEPASYAAMRFSINLHCGLAPGTQIKNTGYIYFDYNPAVATNTVLNTIESLTYIAPVTAHTDIKIYPNPATDQVYVENLQNGHISILGVNGTVLIDQTAISNKTAVDISALPPGVYILKATGTDKSSATRFVRY